MLSETERDSLSDILFNIDLANSFAQGFDYERARVELQIPEDFHIDAMAVVGKPGDKDALVQHLCAVISDRPRAVAMAQAASERVCAQFEVSRMARDYHNDYLGLLRRSCADGDIAIAMPSGI